MIAAFSSIARLIRIAATLRRTGGLDPLLGHFIGHSPRSLWIRRVIWALTTPLWPIGQRGDLSLPPVSRGLSALGPSHVKFGQILSTRPDIVGDRLSRDLKFLQDKLPPFSDEAARKTIARQLGAPVEQLFRRLDPPIAAASIAQVHPGVTLDGKNVAVKVLRPNVERAFARDISAFYFIARFLEWVAPQAERLRPRDVVAHFESVVTREMDLRIEAAAGSEYGQNTQKEPGFRTPQIFWDLSAKRVLTTGWVDGTPLNDAEGLRAREIDQSAVAKQIIQLFLRTALRDGYFHADMHPGNLKIASDGSLAAYDFGIMGRIDARTRRTYAEILYSYITRDYRRGAQAHFDAGYVPADQDLELFAQALRSIGEPIVGLRASRISMARVLEQLFDVTERFGMQTRPELLLLQRSMVVVEGVARSMDPDFDMWGAAQPEVERWMQDNIGPIGAARNLSSAALSLSRIGPRLPELAERLVAQIDRAPPGKEIAVTVAAPSPSGGRFWPGALVGATVGAVAVLVAGVALGLFDGVRIEIDDGRIQVEREAPDDAPPSRLTDARE